MPYNNFSNPRTSRDWLQLEPLVSLLLLKHVAPLVAPISLSLYLKSPKDLICSDYKIIPVSMPAPKDSIYVDYKIILVRAQSEGEGWGEYWKGFR